MRLLIGIPFLVLVAAGLFFSGCDGEEKPEGTANPFAGETITVSVPAGLGLERAWELSLAEWKRRTGAELEVIARSPDDESPWGDLVLLPITEIAANTDSGSLTVISEQVRGSAGLNWHDLLKGLRSTVGRQDDGSVAVPISCPVLTCYYREDLLNAAGLAVPTTWDEYQRLLETTHDWAGGLPGVEPWGEEFRATMFLARAVSYVKNADSYSVFFDITTGQPLIDNPGFVRALEASTAAVKKMPAEVLTFDAQDCRREFFAGRAAMAITFETGIGNPPATLVPARARESVEAVEQRPAEMRAGFSRLPGVSEVYLSNDGAWVTVPAGTANRVALVGFGGLCAAVSGASSETDRDAAWNLLAFLIGNEQFATTFPPATRSLCRESHLSFPEIWLPEDLTTAEGGGYLGEVSRTLRSEALVVELAVIGRGEFRQSLTAGLSAVLNGDQSETDGLNAVAEKWNEIAESLGKQKVLNSYRSGLGLRPMGRGQ